MGFKEAKRRIVDALKTGSYQHEIRDKIDEKNLLQTGDVRPEDVIAVINRCNGTHHSSSAHHVVRTLSVHVLKRDGWYIKFYFLDDGAVFISVHM
jgi:hypothetical protein